jgi:alpha-ribazole phosphatase/probable phosphoglycerate mutase
VGAEGRFVGHADVPLSPVGLRQADALAARLGGEPIEAVYTSDLRRARQSAAPLAAARGVAAVPVPALREVAMGRWDGLTAAEIRARDPELWERWVGDPVGISFPGGESVADLRARVLPAWRALIERHAGGYVAVVAHGGVNRVILAEALGLPPGNLLRLAQDHAGWSVLEYRRESVIVHAVNRRVADAGALPGAESVPPASGR